MREVFITRTQTGATVQHAGTFGAFLVADTPDDGNVHRTGIALAADPSVHVVLSLVSGEDDWKDNQPSESCIPAGRYRLKRREFERKKRERKPLSTYLYDVFEVMAVPGRSAILLHPIVTEEWTEGCIGMGERYQLAAVRVDEDTGEKNVRKFGLDDSPQSFQRFMDVMAGIDASWITIEWLHGLP